jgi:hypothetical protein
MGRTRSARNAATVQAAPADGLRTIDLLATKMGDSFETLYGLWGDVGLDISHQRPRALYLYGRDMLFMQSVVLAPCREQFRAWDCLHAAAA